MLANNATDFLSRDELLQLGLNDVPEEILAKAANLANFCNEENPEQKVP